MNESGHRDSGRHRLDRLRRQSLAAPEQLQHPGPGAEAATSMLSADLRHQIDECVNRIRERALRTRFPDMPAEKLATRRSQNLRFWPNLFPVVFHRHVSVKLSSGGVNAHGNAFTAVGR